MQRKPRCTPSLTESSSCRKWGRALVRKRLTGCWELARRRPYASAGWEFGAVEAVNWYRNWGITTVFVRVLQQNWIYDISPVLHGSRSLFPGHHSRSGRCIPPLANSPRRALCSQALPVSSILRSNCAPAQNAQWLRFKNRWTSGLWAQHLRCPRGSACPPANFRVQVPLPAPQTPPRFPVSHCLLSSSCLHLGQRLSKPTAHQNLQKV